MKCKSISFKTADDLYEFNKAASRCKTEVRIRTKSGTFNFDAKTLLGLFFAMNLPSIEVYYDETETELDEYLNKIETTD